MADGPMTWVQLSELVMKLKSAPQNIKNQGILYVNFDDYIVMRKRCPRDFFIGDQFLGIEFKATYKCPEGNYYIIRR